MKKLIVVLFLMGLSLSVMACSSKPKLYVLNWGDYMDKELLDAFEDTYNVKIVYKEVGSNEEMSTLILAGSSPYDIAIPSDYMIDQLKTLNLIQPIDYTKLTHFESLKVIPKLYQLYDSLGYADYMVPYAWGTIGILYNTQDASLKPLIEAEEWGALFEYGDTYQTGMYDSPRDAIASALLYQGYNVNSENTTELYSAEVALKNGQFYAWGEDNLKSLVIQGTLDMALVYSGDYFSEYYLAIEDGLTVEFDFYVPNTTNVWVDGMVIPTTAQNVELAHQFINFFLDEANALQNSDYIGYAPCYEIIYNTMVQNSDYGYNFETFNPYPEGTYRQMYVYGSDNRSDLLVNILARAKAAND